MSKSNKDDVTLTFNPSPPRPDVEGETIVQLDDQGHFIEAHSYGNFVERIEGGVRVTRPDGSTISMIDGELIIENLSPKSVGIQDLSEIESFLVRTVDEKRIYRIDFFGGGYIEVAYSKDGQVKGYSGRNFNQTLTKDNEIIVSRRSSANHQAN
jgi:WD40 repeat protein